MHSTVSLLEVIDGAGIEASVITTYSAYFPFYEDVVLRRLVARGCRHNTLLIDAAQLSLCFDSPSLMPTVAGFDYTLAPIRSAAAFHPKLILLVGPKRAVTCIGSHNLTVSGFGVNREATAKTDWQKDGEDWAQAVARTAWKATRTWLDKGGYEIPRSVIENFAAIEEMAPWIRDTGDHDHACQVLYQGIGTDALWNQLIAQVRSPVKSVTLVGAFFDHRCEFIRAVERAYPDADIHVAIDPKTVQLEPTGSKGIRCTWHDGSMLAERKSYLHAKLVFLDTGGKRDILYVGSANPSAPAWGIGKVARNEELGVIWVGQQAREFADQLGIRRSKNLPVLTSAELTKAGQNRKPDERNIDSSPIGGLAEVTEGVIEVPLSAWPAHATAVTALDGQRQALSINLKIHQNGESIQIPLLEGSGEQIRFLEVAIKSGRSKLFICHHCDRRKAAAQSSKQAKLREALSGLQGDPTQLQQVLEAVKKVVFSRDVQVETLPKALRSAGSATPTQAPTVTTLEGTRKTGSEKLRPRISRGELADLLQILIYEIGKSLPRNEGSTGPTGRTEEEQIDSDDETPEVQADSREADLVIAEMVGNRVGTLVRRMIRALEEASSAKAPALNVAVQLTAVLCTLRALRQLDRHDRWKKCKVSLVPEEHREALLQGIRDSVIGGPRALIHRPEVLASQEALEIAQLRSLMIWLAWDCKYSAQHRFSIADDLEIRDNNVLQRATLLELLVPAVTDPDICDDAERNIDLTAADKVRVSARSWVQSHLKWGQMVFNLMEGGPKPNQPSAVNLGTGSIVLIPGTSGKAARVVTRNDSNIVVVTDFGAEDWERGFQSSKVQLVLSA